jgi:hypothetical protein
VHAFVGPRALLLPSRQGYLPAYPSSASLFLPPLFPYHASRLILSLHLYTGKQQGGKLALVLRSDGALEPTP